MADNPSTGDAPLTEQVGQKVKEKTAKVKEQTEQVGQKVQDQTQQVKQQAQEAVQQGQHAAGRFVDHVRGQIKTQVTAQKERVATGLDETADTLRQTSELLRSKGQDVVVPYADQLADRVAQFGGSLHEKDVDQLVQETEQFARTRPGLFLTGAAVLGLLAARYLKSSSRSTGATAT